MLITQYPPMTDPFQQQLPPQTKKPSKLTPIEDVIDVRDPNILWEYIPGFNGYEVNPQVGVRSMKHFREYPYGLLIKPRSRKNQSDPTYELTNNNNERVCIRFSQLIYLAKTNPWGVTGYPRRTCISDTASRNQRCCIKRTAEIPMVESTSRYPKFTVLEDPKDDPRAYETLNAWHEPIFSLDGSTYYGREDCPKTRPRDVY